MVTVPEFSDAAMENYGLITYREYVLLYDDLLSPADRKQFVSYIYISNRAFISFFSFAL